MRTRLVVLALVLALGGIARSGELPKAEKQALAKLAQDWVELGKWCAARKLGEEARTCLGRAQGADTAAARPLADVAAACTGTAAEKDAKEWERREKALSKKAAASYEKLAQPLLGEADLEARERGTTYLYRAVELEGDPKRWAKVLALAEGALAAKEAPRASRLAERALALGPPEKLAPRFRGLADAGAIEGLVLRKAAKHPMRYWFSLPPGYERAKNKKWPVIVCVDGAGSNFEGMGAGYRGARAGLPYVVVSPCTFSNTNKIVGDDGQMSKYRRFYSDEVIQEGDRRRLEWDAEGIVAVLAELRETHDVESRAYVTGFSGGGIATYMMAFEHPDLVAGAAPACGNFRQTHYGRDLKGKFAPEDLAFPVLIYTGEKDEHREFTFGNKSIPGIEPQTDWAVKAFEEVGYPAAHRKRTLVPGLGHSPAIEQVVAGFRPYIEGKKKRSDPP